MTPSFSDSVVARQYRLATLILVVGLLSTGVLVLTRFTELYYDSIFFYYGVHSTNYHEMHAVAGLPLQLGHLVVVALSLLGVVVFVRSERRRLARVRAHRCVCARRNRCTAVTPLARPARLRTLGHRTALFAGALLAIWLVQTSYERLVSGYGWGPAEYAQWSALLPLLTVFLGCVLIGLFVAAVSMFGLRTIVALRLAMARRLRPAPRRRIAWVHHARPFTARDLFGLDLLSRPPPASLRATA